MALHTAAFPSRLDPVFFSRHAHSPYNTILDHRATEQPPKNQQKNTDCNCGRGAHVGTERARPQRPQARMASPIHPRRLWTGSWGAKFAQRLWVRDRIERRLWHCTEESLLLAATPHFFHSTLTCDTTRYGIKEHHNIRAKISRKCRLQPQVALGAHVGAARARPQRPRAPVASP